VRVDVRLDDGLWRDVRSLPPSRAFSKNFMSTATTLDRRPRRSFH
jgi:hypothetical protein